MAKKKKAKKNTRLTNLVNAAEELNEKLGLEPPIKTDGVSEEDLEEKLLEASELLTDEDELTKGTEAVLDSLEVPEEEEEEFEEEFEESEEEEEDEEDDEFEEEEPEDQEEVEEAEEAEEVGIEELEALKKEVKSLKKRGDLVDLANKEPIFEELLDGMNKLRSGKAVAGAMVKLLQATIDYKEAEEEEKEPEEKPKKKATKKKATKKASKKSSKKESKPEKKATKKKASKKAKKSKGQSNKGQIYLAWKDGEEDVEKLHELVDQAVKLSTIRSWVNGWKNGRGLPAVAKD